MMMISRSISGGFGGIPGAFQGLTRGCEEVSGVFQAVSESLRDVTSCFKQIFRNTDVSGYLWGLQGHTGRFQRFLGSF